MWPIVRTPGALALVPWMPHNSLPRAATMFCDAARHGGIYYVGQWGTELGMCIKQLPDWVAPQQATGLAGVVDAVRLSHIRETATSGYTGIIYPPSLPCMAGQQQCAARRTWQGGNNVQRAKWIAAAAAAHPTLVRYCCGIAWGKGSV